MKSWMKGMLAASGALLMMGVALTVTGQLMGAKSLEYHNGEWHLNDNKNASLFLEWNDEQAPRSKTEKEFSLEGETIESIKTEDDITANLVIRQGNAWEISYDLDYPEKFSYQLKGKELKIDYQQPSNSSLDGAEEQVITITVPKDAQLKEIDVASSMGNIEMDDLICQKVEAECSLGNNTVNNLQAEEIELSNSLGNITTQNLTVEKEAKFSASTGNIDADGTFHGNVEVSVDLGNARLIVRGASRNDYELEASSDMGNLVIDGDKMDGEMMGADFQLENGQDRKIQIDSSVGDVEITFEQ